MILSSGEGFTAKPLGGKVDTLGCERRAGSAAQRAEKLQAVRYSK